MHLRISDIDPAMNEQICWWCMVAISGERTLQTHYLGDSTPFFCFTFLFRSNLKNSMRPWLKWKVPVFNHFRCVHQTTSFAIAYRQRKSACPFQLKEGGGTIFMMNLDNTWICTTHDNCLTKIHMSAMYGDWQKHAPLSMHLRKSCLTVHPCL